jgi:peptidyl-prolyl cis-trans isomerase B (cyclophilin B)
MTFYPGNPGYPGYPPPPPPRETNGWAIAALVAAFTFPPMAIVCGHVALSQLNRTGDEGRGLAIAGLVVGYVLTALIVVFVAMMIWFMIMFDQSLRDYDRDPYSSYSMAVTSIRTGPGEQGPLRLTGV